MNDYSGLSRAVREELEQRTEAENLEKLLKRTPTTEPDDEGFWNKLRESFTLLTNKTPK